MQCIDFYLICVKDFAEDSLFFFYIFLHNRVYAQVNVLRFTVFVVFCQFVESFSASNEAQRH